MKYVLWLSIAIAAGISIAGPVVDPDLWWHITVGKWILGHGEIPTTEQWNYFAMGEPWRAYSWSVEVVVALLDRLGPKGLIGGKLVLGVIIAMSFMFSLGRVSKDYFFGGVLGLFATAACFNHFTLRPQSFVWIYFAMLMFFTDEVDRKGLTWKRGLGVAGMMALWSNAQITQVIGVAAVVGWMLRDKESLPLALKVTGCALLGTLLTPSFGAEWLTFFKKSGHPLAYSQIAEFGPANILMYSTAFLVLIMGIALFFIHTKPSRVPLPLGLYVLAACGAGLAVVKFLPFAVLVTCFFCARLWRAAKEDGEGLGNIGESFEQLRVLFRKFPKEGTSFVFLCTAIVNGYKVWNYPVSFEVAPVRAMDLIIDKDLPKPLLHGFGRGGYVMYRLSNDVGELEHPVVMDGRTNVNPPHVWKAFISALNGKESWRDLIELTNPQTILWRNESALTSLLRLSDEWCQIYRGETNSDLYQGYSIFLHRNAMHLYDEQGFGCVDHPPIPVQPTESDQKIE